MLIIAGVCVQKESWHLFINSASKARKCSDITAQRYMYMKEFCSPVAKACMHLMPT